MAKNITSAGPQLPVIIIGAGISGLLLAQHLLRQGIRFRIFERDNDFATRGVGWGLTLHWALSAARELLGEEHSPSSKKPTWIGKVSKLDCRRGFLLRSEHGGEEGGNARDPARTEGARDQGKASQAPCYGDRHRGMCIDLIPDDIAARHVVWRVLGRMRSCKLTCRFCLMAI